MWLNHFDSDCPACNEASAVSQRERRIKGWIGIQRYFSAEHYGIDLIRNGRVIQELDKSFFYWLNSEQETELEYPVDGHQRLGRIVGELEIDFVKVTHQKDSFEENTQDWRDVVGVIRGDGPIRPNIAKSQGYAVNTSPLARLFSAFRNAKAGIKNLVPERKSGGALITDAHIDDLVYRFYEGETDYQSDDKWWALVNEAGSGGGPTGPADPTGGNPFEQPKPDDPDPADGPDEPDDDQDPESISGGLQTEPDTHLSKNYSIDLFKNVSVRVVAERVLAGQHSDGFCVELKGVELRFAYWKNAQIFENSLMRPADFLINELAYHMHSIAQNEVSRIPISVVELAIREKYFSELFPTVDELHRQIRVFTEELVDHLRSKAEQVELNVSVISENEMDFMKQRMATNESLDDQQAEEAIKKGEFISYASFSVLHALIREHPQLVFDGVFFRQNWPTAAEPSLIMDSLKGELNALLNDVEWFNANYATPGGDLWRSRARRLVGSLEILINWRV